MNNLATVANLLWFTLNVKKWNSLDLLGVYGFKWFNMYVIQNNIVSILFQKENEKDINMCFFMDYLAPFLITISFFPHSHMTWKNRSTCPCYIVKF
jgi:hypothetical protein